MKKLIYTLILLIQYSVGQVHESPPLVIHAEPSQNIYLTKTIFPIFESESSRVDLYYTVPKNFLIYTRDTDTSFKAECEISLEIKNKTSKNTEFRKIQTQKFITSTPPTDDLSYFNGMFSFNLKNGLYQIVFEVRDKESSRFFLDNKKEFEVPEKNNNFSELLFIQCVDTTTLLSSKLYNIAYGDYIPFNLNFCIYVEFNQNYFNNLHPEIEFYNVIENQKNIITFDQNSKLLLNSIKLLPVIDSTYYIFEKNNNYGGMLIFLPSLKLNTGKYEIIIKLQKDSEPIKKNFEIHWIDIPRTLKNMRLAIDLLEYIATPEEMREMKVLNPRTIKDKFETFWKKLDPTPETAYNEAMVEFYKRADYAMEQFSTLKNDIGAKTDRGKIYILYGNPNNIERIILPRTTPKEIWTYNNLYKKFIFEDKNLDGNYKLIKIENL